jgi:hypothetical protein
MSSANALRSLTSYEHTSLQHDQFSSKSTTAVEQQGHMLAGRARKTLRAYKFFQLYVVA